MTQAKHWRCFVRCHRPSKVIPSLSSLHKKDDIKYLRLLGNCVTWPPHLNSEIFSLIILTTQLCFTVMLYYHTLRVTFKFLLYMVNNLGRFLFIHFTPITGPLLYEPFSYNIYSIFSHELGNMNMGIERI